MEQRAAEESRVFWARLQIAPRDPKGNELSRTLVVHLWQDPSASSGQAGWHIQNGNRLYDLSEIAWWGRRIDTGQLSPEQLDRREAREHAS